MRNHILDFFQKNFPDFQHIHIASDMTRRFRSQFIFIHINRHEFLKYIFNFYLVYHQCQLSGEQGGKGI